MTVERQRELLLRQMREAAARGDLLLRRLGPYLDFLRDRLERLGVPEQCVEVAFHAGMKEIGRQRCAVLAREARYGNVQFTASPLTSGPLS